MTSSTWIAAMAIACGVCLSCNSPVSGAPEGGENVPAIVNDGGRWWRDVDGSEMICFPNTVLKVGDTFYMYGEWCFEDENSGKNVLRCYSSKDLAHWKFEGDVLTQEDSHLINRGTVLYNPRTKQYVYCYKFRRPMRFPGWKVGDGILAWATCSSQTGQFKVANKDQRVGIVAGEVTLFRDDDGKAYVLTDGTFDPKEGKRLNLYELSPDYCGIVRRVCDLGTGHEAVSIHKIKGKYLSLGGQTTHRQRLEADGYRPARGPQLRRGVRAVAARHQGRRRISHVLRRLEPYLPRDESGRQDVHPRCRQRRQDGHVWRRRR
jgi:hypothetical protein